MTLKLVVFPSDSLKVYYTKGEIKERYFNPNNYFDEVHFISLNDEEVEAEKVQQLVGKAKIYIHTIGRWKPWPIPKLNLIAYQRKILRLVREIDPTAIRAYDSLLPGYLATYCGKKLNVPSVISLHADFDEEREYNRQFGKLRYWKFYWYSKMFEKAALQKADKIMCVTKFLTNYAKKYAGESNPPKIEVIYNRVDTKRFKRGDRVYEEPVRILCVGRQNKQKNQQCLIRAIQKLPAELILIGDGDQHEYLVSLAKELGIGKKVKFIKSVPHSEIHKWYADVDIFAIATDHEGMCCHPNTLIITDNGLKPISEVTLKDRVMQNDSKMRYIKKVSQRKINESIIKITPHGASSIYLTKGHKVWAIKKPKKRWGKLPDYTNLQDFRWIEVEKLRPKDCVFLPCLPIIYKNYSWDLLRFDIHALHDLRHVWYKMGYSIYYKKEPKKFKRFIPLNSSVAYMLGYYVAQGSSSKNVSNFAAGNKKEELKKVNQVMKSFFGIKSQIRGTKNNYQLNYCGKMLTQFFLETCGKGARNKKIPLEIFYSDNNIKKSFLKGFKNGDGCTFLDVKANKFRNSLSTSSCVLANQLIMLLNDLGYRAGLSIDKRGVSYNVVYMDTNLRTHSNKSWIVPGKGTVKSIRKIERIKYAGPVYDLYVPNGNNYTTSSFNIHNCIPVVEALAASLPVVVTNKEPLPEVVQDAGILVERNPRAFARAFKKLIEHPELRAQLGLKGKLRSMDFDTQVIEEKEAKMYDGLINNTSNQITTLLGDTRWLHEERMNYLTNKLRGMKGAFNKPLRVLDIGCGDGIVTSYIVQALKEDTVIGVDYDTLRLKRLSSKLKITAINGDATKLPIQDNYADIINIHHVLEHIPEEEKAISEMRRVLKPGGYLIIGVPHEGGILGKMLRVIHWRMYRKSKNIQSGWHVNFYSRKSLTEKLAKQGLKVVEIKGVGMIFPFYPIHYFILKRRKLFRIGNWISQHMKWTSDSLFFIVQKLQKL